MKKSKLILSLMIAAIVAVSAIVFSSFSADKKQSAEPLQEYYWYVVDYSVPGGRVPAGATPVFSGVKKTKAFAQANDDCEDIDDLDCLRGFINIPSLPTQSFDETTPMPENGK